MANYAAKLAGPRPFFAELPYYLWGRVNYDSEGDCSTPLDRAWTWMHLTHRETKERLAVTSEGDVWTVSGPDPAAARLVTFLIARCGGQVIAGEPEAHVGEWDHVTAMARAAAVARAFEDPLLVPFAVDHVFWGSWKWIGWFGTEFTWIGRWIMDAVVRNDPRAVEPCVDWLRDGTFSPSQSAALRHALGRLTGLGDATDAEWIAWYDQDGLERYPAPNIDAWYADLQKIHGV
jgi:hypothetical protein